MATELLALDEISSSQSQKEVTHNTALRQIEGRMVRAKDKDLTTPPGSPAAGDTYIVPAGASGVWSGHTNKIAHFYGGAWVFWTPIEGVRLWLNDEDIEYAFNGTSWVVNAGAGLTPPFADTTEIVKGSADATKKARLEVDGLTTGTTRVLTVQNRDYTLAGTDDITTHEAAADPHTGYQKESEKAAANGYASLDSGGLVPAAQLPAASSLPVADTTEIIKGSGDATKKIRFEVDGLTTATTRVLTVPDADMTLGDNAYLAGAMYNGAPTASMIMLHHVVTRQVIFPASLTGSQGKAGTAATAQTDFDIQKNGSSVGTMRFAASGTSATFIMASQQTFAAGDILKVVAPVTPDATLANITFTLSGTR